ncbi:GNAT family N-acetyltransferase [Emticicia sp. W12TSBA100-4]|uniref:GNAT family N-acetyltransferase n=1 Tax=Emticicia sp. W12TSBA100-4 TaxID=3160965 RepID=UPI003305650D
MIELTWDSDFFNKKIGRIDITDDYTFLVENLEKAFQQGYNLIYVFGNKNTNIPSEILEEFNGKIVDNKITYSAKIEDLRTKTTIEIKEFKEQNGNKLYELAYLSGTHSRFRLDEDLSIENFKRLYREWIDKSVSHQIAEKVFVYEENKQIKAMVTLGIKEKTANIGLIAVDKTLQGKGIGMSLIDACVQCCKIEGIISLDVPTQLENTQACRFYEKCGFTEKSVQNIYHFWA